MLNRYVKKICSVLTRKINQSQSTRLTLLFNCIIKNNLELEKNSEDTEAIREHQILRLKLAKTLKKSSTTQLQLLVKSYAYSLKQFTASLHQDIELLSSEFFFKKLNNKLLKNKLNGKKFCRILLISTLYFQPWELKIKEIIAKLNWLLLEKNPITEDILKFFYGYLFNLMTNYVKEGEANKHAVCIETALAEIVIFLKSGIDFQTQAKILTIFKETYSGSLPLCNNSSLKELIQHCRFLAELTNSVDKTALLPLQKIATKRAKKIRLGLLRYETSQEIKIFADIYPLLNPNLFEIHLFTLCDQIHNEIKPILAIFSSYKNFHLQNISQHDPISAINQIREKEIDILITASCLTGSVFWPAANLPTIFTLRAAPIQCFHISDVITSGISNMDYIFIENYYADKKVDNQFTEKVISTFKAVRNFPAIEFQHIDKNEARKNLGIHPDAMVFFSNAHLFKLSPELLRTWISILQRTPNTYLYLMPFSQPYMQWFLRRFKKCLHKLCQEMDVNVNRIILSFETGKTAMGAALQASDIYLDTFPYSGHTSTNEALCAGLPVVTLAQQPVLRSNLTACLLQLLELENFITYSETDYINLANKFATTKESRETFVATAQKNLALLDQPETVAKSLEEVFINLYDKHIERIEHPQEPTTVFH